MPRILPARLAARIERAAWPLPPLFQWLKEEGNIADAELYRVFNCGIGMVVVVARADAASGGENAQGRRRDRLAHRPHRSGAEERSAGRHGLTRDERIGIGIEG